MNFDNFNKINFIQKEILLEECKEAEKSVYTNPFNTISNARLALEILCKGLIKEQNIPRKDENKVAGLCGMIADCLEENIFQDGDAATIVRKAGNDGLHGNIKDSYHKVTENNVEKAKDVLKSLYTVLQQAFGLTSEADMFDEKKIPFGDYEVVRMIPKSAKEVIFGDYNYFVHNKNDEYFYFQIFSSNNKEEQICSLSERNQLAGKKIKKDKNRQRYLLEAFSPYILADGSDREYIVYTVFEDSKLLSEFNGTMSEKQAIRVGLDLLETLAEMKKIANGMNHRNIQPGCVMITPDDNGNYMATLVNMETTKIPDYEYTVIGSIKDLFSENPYMPSEIRNYKDGQEIRWEKVDIYSVAKIMLYCVDPKLVEKEMDSQDLGEIFSCNLMNAFGVVFGSSLSEIYTLEEFKEILENEIK